MTDRDRKKNKKGNNEGFSIIEIMVVIAIISILLSVALFLSLDFYRDYAARSEGNLVVSILQKARSQSLNNIDGASHGVYIDAAGNNYILFEGSSYSDPTRDTSKDIAFEMSKGTEYTGDNEVVFDQLTARTSPASLSIKNNARQTDIDINEEGRINW